MVKKTSKQFLRLIGALVLFQAIYVFVAVLHGANPPPAQAGSPGKFSEFALTAPAPSKYAGDQACATCHQEKVRSYHRTAHAITSSLPSRDTIGGKFTAGENILQTVNPNLHFEMEAKDGGFFQTALVKLSDSQILARTERFGVVIGSGRKGQTYLFWDGNQLFELPVSYWTELGRWINSPSYPDGTASFERPVHPRCLECHATDFESRGPPFNAFNQASLVLGVTCEKCHGPGQEHIRLFSAASAAAHPPANPAILNPAKLPRKRQIDACALCHAGIGQSLTPPLSFAVGDELDRHLVFPAVEPGAHIDVHASQVQLLERSRCFQSSPAMTCTTCHDVHAPQRDPAAFAARCLECHQVESCRKFPALGHRIDQACVTCHMPLQETDQIMASLDGKNLSPKVRNHQIAIYPEAKAP